MQDAQQRSISSNIWTVKINRYVVRRYRLEVSGIVSAVQVQGARRFAPEIHASHKGERLAEAVRVEHVVGIHIPVLALPDPAIAEVRPHIQRAVPVKARKLELAPLGQVPDIIQDQRAVRGLFPLTRVIRIIGDISANGNQARLESKAALADAGNREVVLAEN